MNETRVKDQAFWEKVKLAVEAGKARGQTVADVVKQFNVSVGGWTYAKGRFGWGRRYGKAAKKAAKFVEYKAQGDNSGMITIKRGDIEISVYSVETLKTVIAALQEAAAQ
jgi:hypothetical protein